MLLRRRLMTALVLVVLFVRAMITTSDPSPVGLALREQAKGFREYIETAEADQMRFEAMT